MYFDWRLEEILFYEGFEEKIYNFGRKHYNIPSAETEFLKSSSGTPHFEFDALGNVCLVRRSAEMDTASPDARELFKKSQILFRELSSELTARGSSLRDHSLLTDIFNGHPNLASIDRKERRFIYRTRTASISSELVTHALGGVAPLPILQAVLGGIGEEISLTIKNRKSDRRLAHLMIVVNESLPFPTATFTIFGVTASEVERAGDFDCFKASSADIEFDYDQETWMLLDPSLLSVDSSEKQVADLAETFVSETYNSSPASSSRPTDVPPEHMNPVTVVAKAVSAVSDTEDIGAQPSPQDFDFDQIEYGTAANLSDVTWPNDDKNSPDYAYLSEIQNDDIFSFSGEAIEKIVAANRYVLDPNSDTIAIALRVQN